MMPLYQKQAEQFHADGYAVFEGVLDAAILEMLREQCRAAVAREDARLDQLGVDSYLLTHRGKRYFAYYAQRVCPELRKVLFSPLMADVCRATLGLNAYFYTDQFVVAEPRNRMAFGWHQPSGYLVGNGGPPEHLPYLSCWLPLDHAASDSDALRVIPFSSNPRARAVLPHQHEPLTNDLVVDVDESRMVVLDVAPGSIVAFSSRAIYSSSANLTDTPRRAYMVDYTTEAIVFPGSRQLRNDAIPLLRNGEHATYG
jgi:ectoine hydroxylase-related dioxygenase (phytanoyl-CoA dioxygenase family)